MKVGDLVRHWRMERTGIVVARCTRFRLEDAHWKVVWIGGKIGWYETCRLERVR